MDEKRILESLKKEDRSAFRELFDAYYDALILFANLGHTNIIAYFYVKFKLALFHNFNINI